MEEDRAIRLYVSGKITGEQLDLQRKFVTERLESLRAKAILTTPSHPSPVSVP